MKMDVEGAEYALLAHLAVSRALCAVDAIMIEWHHRSVSRAEAGRGRQPPVARP